MKRLMITGFGDVARRALPRLEDHFEVLRIARRYGSDLAAAAVRALAEDALAGVYNVYSFTCESRRLDSRRMKQVLGVRLRYPTVYEGLRHERALGVD